MLNHEQSLALIRRAKLGDKAAAEELLSHNTSLLKSLVKRFLNKGIEFDDLYQLACLGFLKAIKNFDEKFEVRFSTYAVPMIVGEIKRFMRDDGAIKVSRAVKVLANKINNYSDEYRRINDATPTVEQLAEHFLIEKEDVVFALDANRYPLSLNDLDDDEDKGRELIDRMQTKDNSDDLVEKIALKTYIEKLPERDKKIIILRYFRDRTQGEIAREMGVSQVQISRIENRILEQMRKEV